MSNYGKTFLPQKQMQLVYQSKLVDTLGHHY